MIVVKAHNWNAHLYQPNKNLLQIEKPTKKKLIEPRDGLTCICETDLYGFFKKNIFSKIKNKKRGENVYKLLSIF